MCKFCDDEVADICCAECRNKINNDLETSYDGFNALIYLEREKLNGGYKDGYKKSEFNQGNSKNSNGSGRTSFKQNRKLY